MLSEDMYQENILEHYKSPHNYGELPDHTCSFRDVNPLCGDVLEMQLIIQDNIIKKIHFIGKGCAISQASASMLTDKVQGMSINEAIKLDMKDILDMLGVEISPARMKCALLSLKVLVLCLNKTMKK